jgi:hypothetical protein
MKTIEEFSHKADLGKSRHTLRDDRTEPLDPVLLQFGRDIYQTAELYRKHTGSPDVTTKLHDTAQKCADYMSREQHIKDDSSNATLRSVLLNLLEVLNTTPIDYASIIRFMFNFNIICPYYQEDSSIKLSSGFSSTDEMNTSGEHLDTDQT